MWCSYYWYQIHLESTFMIANKSSQLIFLRDQHGNSLTHSSGNLKEKKGENN